MTMKEFIKEYKVLIDRVIKEKCDISINDKERRLWVLHDKGLYHFARSEGVKI